MGTWVHYFEEAFAYSFGYAAYYAQEAYWGYMPVIRTMWALGAAPFSLEGTERWTWGGSLILGGTYEFYRVLDDFVTNDCDE